jgi:hypothetical protein
MPLQKKWARQRKPGPVGFSFSRCFAEPIRKFTDKEINFPLGAAARISVTPFQKHDQMIPLSLHAVDFIGRELFPLILEFASELLPSGPQNILIHSCYLSLIFFFGTTRSSAAMKGSAPVMWVRPSRTSFAVVFGP